MACGEALGIDHASGNTKLFRELQTTHWYLGCRKKWYVAVFACK
jgi:hypothetical protein